MAQWLHTVTKAGSTLDQVMACCLTAPSHYLNQCWIIICDVLMHLHQSIHTERQATILYNRFENYTFRITATSPKAQWLKMRPSPQWVKSILVQQYFLLVVLDGMGFSTAAKYSSSSSWKLPQRAIRAGAGFISSGSPICRRTPMPSVRWNSMWQWTIQNPETQNSDVAWVSWRLE